MGRRPKKTSLPTKLMIRGGGVGVSKRGFANNDDGQQQSGGSNSGKSSRGQRSVSLLRCCRSTLFNLHKLTPRTYTVGTDRCTTTSFTFSQRDTCFGARQITVDPGTSICIVGGSVGRHGINKRYPPKRRISVDFLEAM